MQLARALMDTEGVLGSVVVMGIAALGLSCWRVLNALVVGFALMDAEERLEDNAPPPAAATRVGANVYATLPSTDRA